MAGAATRCYAWSYGSGKTQRAGTRERVEMRSLRGGEWRVGVGRYVTDAIENDEENAGVSRDRELLDDAERVWQHRPDSTGRAGE
jgi:hypothetical protein